MTAKPAAIAALLRRREEAIATIETIDAELSKRGVRAVAPQPPRVRPAASVVLGLVADGRETSNQEVRAALRSDSDNAVNQLLWRMARDGEIERVGHGRYRMAERAR